MNAVSTLEEVVTNNKLSPKKNYTAVQLSIFFNFESECYQFILFQYDLIYTVSPRRKHNVTMENPEFEDVFPIEKWGFSNVILVFQGVITRGGSNDAFQHSHHGISTGKASGDDSVGLLPTKERLFGLQQMFRPIILMSRYRLTVYIYIIDIIYNIFIYAWYAIAINIMIKHNDRKVDVFWLICLIC